MVIIRIAILFMSSHIKVISPIDEIQLINSADNFSLPLNGKRLNIFKIGIGRIAANPLGIKDANPKYKVFDLLGSYNIYLDSHSFIRRKNMFFLSIKIL